MNLTLQEATPILEKTDFKSNLRIILKTKMH